MDQPCRRCTSPSTFPSKKDTRKPIKPPTVTPRRFRKFFTPLPPSKIQRNVRTSRRALQDLTNPPLISEKDLIRISRGICRDGSSEKISCFQRGSQGNKRKLSCGSMDSPLQSSPLKAQSLAPVLGQSNGWLGVDYEHAQRKFVVSGRRECDQDSEVDTEVDEAAMRSDPGSAVRRYQTLSQSCRLLSNSITGRRRQFESKQDENWQHETARFYSKAGDSYTCETQASASYDALPFCSSSCNSKCLETVQNQMTGVNEP
jgi:hypothetical protein